MMLSAATEIYVITNLIHQAAHDEQEHLASEYVQNGSMQIQGKMNATVSKFKSKG